MKGILTDCRDETEREVYVDYKVVETKGERVFQLVGGPTGYESFYIDNDYTSLEAMCEGGWLACAGTKGRYDRLSIPAEEMSKALASYR